MNGDIRQRLLDACVGHPAARIPWPHRLLHDAADRIAELVAENERLRNGDTCARACEGMAYRIMHRQEKARAERAEAELAAALVDAERYRELRRLATTWPTTVLVVNINIGHDWRTADAPEEIDSVVDAAIARGKHGRV